MEQHEVYEQIIEVNNINQDTEFISQQLVQEIVQNDNQVSAMSCEISEMEIMLSNDCVNVQEQGNNEVLISCTSDGIVQDKHTDNVILQETNDVETISQINNVDETNIGCTDSYKKGKEEFNSQNQISYQENLEFNNSNILDTNLETDKKENVSEKIVDINETVHSTNLNDSVPDSTNKQSVDKHDNLNNSQSIIVNPDEINHRIIKVSEQNLTNVFADEKEAESFINSIQTENIESMEVDSTIVNEVVDENVVTATEEPQTKSTNQCINEEQNKEVCTMFSNHSDVSTQNEKNSESLSSKVEYSDIMTETVSETIVVTNSDDVAVLTEFSSIEYSTEEDVPKEIEKGSKDDFSVNKSQELEQLLDEQNKLENIKRKEENITKHNVKVEENDVSFGKTQEEVKSTDASIYDQLENDNDEQDELELHLSTQSNESHRKVIQDIFNDWQDENGEEENNQSSMFKEHQDSVEKELQNLLNDGVQQEQTISSNNTIEHNNYENFKDSSAESSPGKEKLIKSEKLSPFNRGGSDFKTNKSQKLNSTPVKEHSIGRSPKNQSQDQADLKSKIQSPRPGVKVPGLHLTSQIASKAEVNEVLQERLREKQKDLVAPKTADIVFVKKITQRLSSQLSSAACSVPPLIPLQSSILDNESKEKSSQENLIEIQKSTSTTDNNDLLAILEGDVDPDWSNLKPQSTLEKSSNKILTSDESNSTAVKLDPIMERELALKQLLELPNIPTKKSNSGSQKKANKNIKTKGKTSNDQSGSKSDSDESKDVLSLSSAEEETPKKTLRASKENKNQNTRSSGPIELNVEESRSGRKRKLTAKALEHELTVKRQKNFFSFKQVFKGKTSVESKKTTEESVETDNQTNDIESSSIKETETPENSSDVVTTSKSSQAKSETKQTKSEGKTNKSEPKITPAKSETKQMVTRTEPKVGVKNKIPPVKRSKIGLIKKDVPISKRKLAVKNLLRQKKIVAGAKTKVQVLSRKSPATDKSSTTTPTTKQKKVSEIDKLLQDEGVVNLLYDVEQPDSRKRLVPITKSQKKIMDVDKAERELKLRTKLVRNAVLRLRNSSSSSVKISPRSRRNVTAMSPNDQSITSDKKSNESKASKPSIAVAATTSLPSDFIIPAKIRNAADASRIIRRHSSSSFSSASASPRVSIDQPPESVKSDDLEPQTKSKRKLSQDVNEKVDKKTKKKVTPKSDTEETNEKSSVKKMTRSNVSTSPVATTTTKATLKNKKMPKKLSTESMSNDTKSPKNQDELSACLAEAASVLSSINNASRSSSTSSSRKKGSTNLSKSIDEEKVDIKKLFSNKEINVRQHGHLVQLILTPSAPISGIRNAITIQVMNELREALSILKKDDDCRVVLFTSTGTSFCEGLELSSLLHSNKEERKARAEEMADAVKEFIRALASFNKPIVAGVQGVAIGLGVTMLPLFDLVIASDKATFSTPYGKLGQIAEGAAVLTLSHSLGSAVTNELLLGGRVLTANEALRAGLVTRVLWPDRFQGELLPSLKAMSEQSSQSMEATKALLRHSLRQKLDTALESESFLLVEHWCSMECQEAIKAYIDEKGQ